MLRKETSCACALVYQLGTLRNDSECGGIELSSMLAEPEDAFVLRSPYVTIKNSGTYLIQYAVFVPKAECVDTMLCLRTAERTLLSSAVHATKEDTSQGATYFGQTLLTVDAPTDICLASGKRLCVSDACATAMATLSILKVR